MYTVFEDDQNRRRPGSAREPSYDRLANNSGDVRYNSVNIAWMYNQNSFLEILLLVMTVNKSFNW